MENLSRLQLCFHSVFRAGIYSCPRVTEPGSDCQVSQREGESSSNYIEDALEFVQLPLQLNQINPSCSEVAFSLQIDLKKQYDKT